MQVSSDYYTGRQLKAARAQLGIGQSKLASELQKLAHLDGETLPKSESLVSNISRWESGKQEPGVYYRYLLRKFYSCSDEKLGFVSGTGRELAPSTAAHPRALLGSDRRSMRVDAGMLDDLDSLTDGFRRIDRRLGAPAVFLDLANHLERVRALRRNAMSPATRGRLATIAGDIAALLGWQALDMGRNTSAWQHFRTAVEAAREGNRPTLHAFVVAQMGYLPLFGGNARAAIPLIGRAREIAKDCSSATFQAWLHAAEAEVLTNVGNAGGALRALDRADRAMARAEMGEEHTHALAHFNEAHLLRWKGQVLGQLARRNEAEPMLRTALGEIDPTFVRARSGLLLDLSHCLVLQGELEESCRVARQALEYARHTGSTRYEHRAVVFRSQLEQWADAPCVRQLDEELAAT